MKRLAFGLALLASACWPGDEIRIDAGDGGVLWIENSIRGGITAANDQSCRDQYYEDAHDSYIRAGVEVDEAGWKSEIDSCPAHAHCAQPVLVIGFGLASRLVCERYVCSDGDVEHPPGVGICIDDRGPIPSSPPRPDVP